MSEYKYLGKPLSPFEEITPVSYVNYGLPDYPTLATGSGFIDFKDATGKCLFLKFPCSRCDGSDTKCNCSGWDNDNEMNAID